MTASYASGNGCPHTPPVGKATLTPCPPASTSQTTGVGMVDAVGHSPNHGRSSEGCANSAMTRVKSPLLLVCLRIAPLLSSANFRNSHTTTEVGWKLSGIVPAGGNGSTRYSGDWTFIGMTASSTSGARHVGWPITCPCRAAAGDRRSSTIGKATTTPTARTATEPANTGPKRHRRIPNTMPTMPLADTFRPVYKMIARTGSRD